MSRHGMQWYLNSPPACCRKDGLALQDRTLKRVRAPLPMTVTRMAADVLP